MPSIRDECVIETFVEPAAHLVVTAATQFFQCRAIGAKTVCVDALGLPCNFIDSLSNFSVASRSRAFVKDFPPPRPTARQRVKLGYLSPMEFEARAMLKHFDLTLDHI